VNPCSGHNIRDLHFAKRWAEQLDLLDGETDELRKSIHWRLRLDE